MTDDDFADLTPAQMVALIRLQQAVIARQKHELRLLCEAERIPLTHAADISCDWPEGYDRATDFYGALGTMFGRIGVVALGAIAFLVWATW